MNYGFGFASVLRDLGFGAQGGSSALRLVSLNLGVETGLVCVAALVLPILAYVFSSQKVSRRGVPVVSSVGAAGTFHWPIE